MRIASLNISEKIKKLGFINIPCQYFYKNSELRPVGSSYPTQPITDIWIDTNCLEQDNLCDAPYLEQVREWIYTEYKLSAEPYSIWDDSEREYIGYNYNIRNNSPNNSLKWYWDWKTVNNNSIFNSYEDAMEAGIDYVTDVLITKFKNDDSK